MPTSRIACARHYLDQAAEDPSDVGSLRMASRLTLDVLNDHLKTPHLTLSTGPGDNGYDALLAVAKDEGLDSLNEALEFVVGEWAELKRLQGTTEG